MTPEIWKVVKDRSKWAGVHAGDPCLCFVCLMYYCRTEIERLRGKLEKLQMKLQGRVVYEAVQRAEIERLRERAEVAEELVWGVATLKIDAEDCRKHIERVSPDAPTWVTGR